MLAKDNLIFEFRLSNLAKALSPATIKFYDDNLTIFFSYLEEEGISTDPSQVTPTRIRQFLASRDVSPYSLHAYYRALRRFYNFLKEEGYIESSPLDKVQPPKLPKLQVRYLNREEVRRFFSAINTKTSIGVRNYSFFLFLLDTGARLSEALNLEIARLDLEGGRAFVIGKGSAERYLFFGHRCSKSLAKYIFHHRPEPVSDDLVFLSRHGRRLDSANIYHICRRIAVKAGLTGRVSPHTFRHTFATQFLADGGNELVLQRLLGHSSLQMVSRYAAITGDHLAKQHKLHSPADRWHL